MSLATPEKIRTLQRKLYRKAKAEPAFRFYVLYDKICREDILRHAYGLARANAGAPGVDGVTFAQIEAQGLEAWLAGLREELGLEDVPARSGAAGDDPEAGRRRATARHSDDPGSGGADRRQARAGTDLRGGLRGQLPMAIVPRAGRWTQSRKCTGCSAGATPMWSTPIYRSTSIRFRIAELMQSRGPAHRRSACPAADQAVAQGAGRGAGWRREAAHDGGKGNTRGTPQGGVASPLLANIYMNRFLKHWRLTGCGEAFRAHVVAYADDFVILSRGRAAEALAWTKAVMTRLGLTLNEAKTSLKNARQERFDFLGYSFGPHRYQSERPMVSEREPVQEEHATAQDEGRRSAGARQQRSVAGSARHAEQISARLVELLLLRDASVGIPRRRPLRL